MMRPPGNPDPRAASTAFGRRLRQLRNEHGLSQDNLARETGIHPTAIARMERGAREPRLTTIQRLAQGLDVHPGALLDKPTTTAPAALRKGPVLDDSAWSAFSCWGGGSSTRVDDPSGRCGRGASMPRDDAQRATPSELPS